ncbi:MULTISPECIES: hypothetical protein [Marinobacter]|uniref:hypothetical protein n=1 Tax=Marinobacter TaxID=2742 RepID=UPI0012473112|nr:MULTISPECIES: hypothetical protein [Marinobacter]MBL3557595.1 hypothetical protein [Marinobacter sp. JB05H06]
MKKLNARLDWNRADVISIQKYLAGYDSGITIYSGDYTADWLLSGIYESKWIIKTAKTVKRADGSYKYVRTLNWNRMLPDGTFLDSPQNLAFLNFFQKAIFVIVESSSIAPHLSVGSLPGLVNNLLSFAQWCFRKDINLNPRSEFLRNLTQERLFCYVREKIHGGIMELFGVAELFKARFFEMSGTDLISDDIYRLTPADITEAIRVFKSKGFYRITKFGDSVIDRMKFVEAFGLPEQITHSDKFGAFLRQFEPDLLRKSRDVLVPVTLEYEFPGHTTPLISDVIGNPENIKQFLGYFKIFLSTRKLFHRELPDSERFRFGDIHTYIQNNQLQIKHTPWIPLPTCLQIINSSVDWVLNKGDSIINAMVDAFDTLHKEDLLVIEKPFTHLYQKRNSVVEKVLKRHQNQIEIASFDYNVRDVNLFRSKAPLTYLIDILRGACLILIASMKPIRLNELSSLKYDCLYFKDNDGFWLMQDIEKAGIRGILPEDAKPIPRVTAKAITLLQKINEHARKHVPSNKEEKYLLYGINYGYDWKSASVADQEFIRSRLSYFCDHIEVPLDEYGRRWYVNTHELRKSFLLNFFWTFKFSSLDSARWMAGHSDPDHVFEYIQDNFEGEEMVEVESEYAYQQLRLFKEGNNLSDVNNIEEIYDEVCNEFKVNSISEVNEDELKQWLEMQIESGHFEVTVFGIENVDENVKAQIAIKIS